MKYTIGSSKNSQIDILYSVSITYLRANINRNMFDDTTYLIYEYQLDRKTDMTVLQNIHYLEQHLDP